MTDFPSLDTGGANTKVNDIYKDVSPQALGQLVDYITQSGIPIPVSQIVGFQQQTRFLDRSATTVDVANTVTETSIYTFTIKANDMGTDRVLRLALSGDYLHNATGTDTCAISVKFGGTTFWKSSLDSGGATSVNRHPWVMRLEIQNMGATNSQAIFGTIDSERCDEPLPTTGVGHALTQVTVNRGLFTSFGATGLGTIDTTVDQKLDITATWTAASANNSWRKRVGFLELL